MSVLLHSISKTQFEKIDLFLGMAMKSWHQN